MLRSAAVRAQQLLAAPIKGTIGVTPRFMSKHNVETDEQFDARYKLRNLSFIKNLLLLILSYCNLCLIELFYY